MLRAILFVLLLITIIETNSFKINPHSPCDDIKFEIPKLMKQHGFTKKKFAYLINLCKNDISSTIAQDCQSMPKRVQRCEKASKGRKMTYLKALLRSVNSCRKCGLERYQQPILNKEKFAANATVDFGFDLFKSVLKSKPDSANVLLSPYSAAIALLLAAEGARGRTQEQMLQGLHMKGVDFDGFKSSWGKLISDLRSQNKITLNTANAAFFHKYERIERKYKDIVKSTYECEVKNVDFNNTIPTTKIINNWVKEKTNDKIPGFLDEEELDPKTKFMLVNAVYFKGNWVTKFDKTKTKKRKFFLSGNKWVEVDMMSVRDYFYDATLHFESSRRRYEMIELPYVGGRFVMQILMPYSDKMFEDLPKASDVDSLFEQQKWESKTIVILPKFKLSFSTDLRKPLESAGMRDMFKGGVADFSGINGKTDLYVNLVKQSVDIEVNEEGSEAAAATAVGGPNFMSAPRRFVVDRPFIFYIRDKVTGVLLFQGRVADPTIK